MVRAARPRGPGRPPLGVRERRKAHRRPGQPAPDARRDGQADGCGVVPRQPAHDCRDRRRERLRHEAGGGESYGEEVRGPGSAVRAADASRGALGGFAARGEEVDRPASDRIAKPRGPIPSLPG